MANLEDVLPSFRIGAKIRREDWGKGCYIQWHQRNIVTQNENDYKFTNEDIISDKWIVYIDIYVDLVVGESYRTRDGKKAFIAEKTSGEYPMKGVFAGSVQIERWQKNGRYSKGIHDNDIIAKWSDDDVE